MTTSINLGYAATLSSYNIYWDAGLGGQFILINQTILNQLTLNNLQTGSTYSFYITASNMYGEGVKSSTVSMRVATAPNTPLPVVLTQVGTLCVINVLEPLSNGAPITSYTVQFLNKSSGTYVTQASLCNGALIVSSLTCQVSISAFSSTLGYSAGQFIKVIVSATNQNGNSMYSNPNTDSVVV